MKKLFLMLMVVVGSTQPLQAGAIIDLYAYQPLGTISINDTGHQYYFSLGNGRAFLFSVDQRKSVVGVRLQKLLLKKVDKRPATHLISRRNLKW